MAQIDQKNTFRDFLHTLSSKIDWKCIGAVSVAFIVTRLMVVVVTYFSMAQIPINPFDDFFRYNPNNIIPDGLIRWDSEWYMRIVNEGYTFESSAFFPLYPLLIRGASFITGNIWTIGLWISNISFFLALIYLYKLTTQEFNDSIASRTVFYIAAAPSAFVFSAVYTESICLLFLCASFYYARNGKWVLAGLIGAFASATRLTGALVCIFILFEALWQKGFRFFPKPWDLKSQLGCITNNIKIIPNSWKGIMASVFSTSGLIAYMVFLYIRFGDPLSFIHGAVGWDRTVNWDWPLRLWKNIIDLHSLTGSIFSGAINNIHTLMDPIAIFLFIPIVLIVFIKFRPSFGLFTLLSFSMCLISGNPVSMRRYVLTLIPCYILLAIWGKRPWIDRIIIGISLPLQAFFLILFSHWYFTG